nr:tripartite tricarboxylate transporter substrate-binding protein [Variovorax sp. HW608]
MPPASWARRWPRAIRRWASPPTCTLRCGTPAPAIDRLNKAMNTALADAGLRKTLGDMGVNPAGGAPDRMAQAIREDIALHRKIIADTHLKIE